MRSGAIWSVLGLLVFSGPAQAGTPSFACDKAKQPDEVAICGSQQLAVLDRLHAASFAYLRDMYNPASAREAARALIVNRKACGSAVDCLTAAYVTALEADLQAGSPIAVPDWALGNTAAALAPPVEAPAVSPPVASPAVAPQPVVASATPAKVEVPPVASDWKYDEDKDDMRGTVSRFASVRSETELRFSFPYDGGVQPRLVVRSMEGELGILLALDKGQFSCNGNQDDTISVKFDGSAVMTFPCGTASDLRGDVLFVKNESEFLSWIKRSHKLIVEAQFFQEGRRQMTFNVDGLRWD